MVDARPRSERGGAAGGQQLRWRGGSTMGRARSSVALAGAGAGRAGRAGRWRHGVNSAVITADMCGGC